MFIIFIFRSVCGLNPHSILKGGRNKVAVLWVILSQVYYVNGSMVTKRCSVSKLELDGYRIKMGMQMTRLLGFRITKL